MHPDDMLIELVAAEEKIRELEEQIKTLRNKYETTGISYASISDWQRVRYERITTTPSTILEDITWR